MNTKSTTFAERISEAAKFFGLDFDTFTVPVANASEDERKTFGATVRAELAKLYKSAATAAHPDQGGADDAMKNVNNMYDLFRGKTEEQAYAELLRQISQHAYDKRKSNRPADVQEHIERAAKFWRDADRAEGNGDAHAVYALYRAMKAELLAFDVLKYDSLDRNGKSTVIAAILRDIFGMFDDSDHTEAMKQRLRRTLVISAMFVAMEGNKEKPIDGAICDIHNNVLRVQLLAFDYDAYRENTGLHPINGRKFGNVWMSIASLETAARLFFGKEATSRKRQQEEAAKKKAEDEAKARASNGGAGTSETSGDAGTSDKTGTSGDKTGEKTGETSGTSDTSGGNQSDTGKGQTKEPDSWQQVRAVSLFINKLAERVLEGETMHKTLETILDDLALALAALSEAEKEQEKRAKKNPRGENAKKKTA
jgi:hypothetical protein